MIRGGLEASSFALGNAPAQARLAGMAHAYGMGNPVTMPVINREFFVAGSSTAYEDATSALPIRQEIAKSEREYAAATAARLANQKELNRLETHQNSLIGERRRLEGEIGKGGSGVGYQQLLERHRNTTEELAGVNMQVRPTAEAQAGFQRDEVRWRSILAGARVRGQKLTAAENLDARADRSESSGRRLGRMNYYDRQLGQYAIQLLENGTNPDFLPPELRCAGRELLNPKVLTGSSPSPTGWAPRRFAGRNKAGKRGFETNDPFGARVQADTLRKEAGEAEYGIET